MCYPLGFSGRWSSETLCISLYLRSNTDPLCAKESKLPKRPYLNSIYNNDCFHSMELTFVILLFSVCYATHLQKYHPHLVYYFLKIILHGERKQLNISKHIGEAYLLLLFCNNMSLIRMLLYFTSIYICKS